MVGEKAVNLPFATEHTVNISKTNHSVFGNPSRFRTGAIELREDDEWRAKIFQIVNLVWEGLRMERLEFSAEETAELIFSIERELLAGIAER